MTQLLVAFGSQLPITTIDVVSLHERFIVRLIENQFSKTVLIPIAKSVDQ